MSATSSDKDSKYLIHFQGEWQKKLRLKVKYSLLSKGLIKQAKDRVAKIEETCWDMDEKVLPNKIS